MKQQTLILTLCGLALIAAGAGGGYWYARQETPTATTDRKVLYWHDPMVPGQKFDRPGKSPFMDMPLVPVYADADASASAVKGLVSINPRTVQNLGIRTVAVKQGHMTTGLRSVGAVSIDERTLITVQSRVSGIIEKLHVRAPYDPVTRDQPLAEIYAPEWLAAQEEFLALRRSQLPGADSLAHAARERLLLLGIAETQIRHLEQTGKTTARVTLLAPAGGLVWELGAREGMAVAPGVTLFKLANLGSVWINAEVPETEAARIQTGTPVTAHATGLPEKIFKGTVAALLPDVNAVTRTLKARVMLANPGGHLKPGMYATLDFGAAAQSALLVPAEAVIQTGVRAVVIVAEGDGRFRPVEVETGRDSDGMTQIRKGLQAGQRVVTSGQFLIDSEASLKNTLARLEYTADHDSHEPIAGGKHSGRGRVNAVDAKTGKLDLRHGPIPSLQWPEMSMGFRVEDKKLLQGIKPGDTIDFEIRSEPNKNDEYIITRITPVTPGTAKGVTQ